MLQREIEFTVFDLLNEAVKLGFLGASDLVEVGLEFNFPFLDERRVLIAEKFLARESHFSEFLVQDLKHGISGPKLVLFYDGPAENLVFFEQNDVIFDVVTDLGGAEDETVVGENGRRLFFGS